MFPLTQHKSQQCFFMKLNDKHTFVYVYSQCSTYTILCRKSSVCANTIFQRNNFEEKKQFFKVKKKNWKIYFKMKLMFIWLTFINI